MSSSRTDLTTRRFGSKTYSEEKRLKTYTANADAVDGSVAHSLAALHVGIFEPTRARRRRFPAVAQRILARLELVQTRTRQIVVDAVGGHRASALSVTCSTKTRESSTG